MSSSCDPRHAPAGDVGAAVMIVDSRLKAVYDGRTGTDAEHQQLIDHFTASLTAQEAHDLLDGMCTLIFMYMKWLRMAHEQHDKDVIATVVPNFVNSMRMMHRTVRPEVIPTMTGMLVAAGLDLSPSLWRRQFGEWTRDEMNPLEATALLLAEHINRITEDRDFATRLITDALSSSEESAEGGADEDPE
ncbi:hypothetical protein [Streptomyces venezuelae]|uniref:hypothetical protein n=1 Tax=Streptomyces venezuelae TaxID=54571 RepID=UPI0012392BF5|nr:hypothetical protein [Streptomyces venezuelae]QES09594.1 hypothetical protein DEJ44_30830 [Streptomyces venezuelae]QES11726.1 hypothetical protein DEJ45_04400 [Streptomyces venezuelae]